MAHLMSEGNRLFHVMNVLSFYCLSVLHKDDAKGGVTDKDTLDVK